MRKITALLLALFAVTAFCSVALAEDNETSGAGKSIPLTDGLATDPNSLVLNFSPSVFGQYLTDAADTDGNKQWFAIATYHGGGTQFYGTSSEQTAVYKKVRDTTQTFGDAGLVTEKETRDAEGVLVDVWGTNSWTK